MQWFRPTAPVLFVRIDHNFAVDATATTRGAAGRYMHSPMSHDATTPIASTMDSMSIPTVPSIVVIYSNTNSA